MSARRPGLRRYVWAGGLALALIASYVTACCPDTTAETCYTLDQWRASDRCKNFPAPPEGQSCPSAEAVAKSCDTDPGPSRADGDKCCYQMPVPCL